MPLLTFNGNKREAGVIIALPQSSPPLIDILFIRQQDTDALFEWLQMFTDARKTTASPIQSNSALSVVGFVKKYMRG